MDIFIPTSRDDFEKWVYNHPHGYVINRRSRNNAMMHFGHCGHFKHSDQSANLTDNLKVCSTSREDLEAYWAEKYALELKRCRSCKT
jgi:hypothetical protein